MKQSFRLAQGGIIDRSKPLNFKFNSNSYQAFEGDTLASALLANGRHFVSRSFKYHRPRGIFTAGEEEPNALLEVGVGAYREPTCRASQVQMKEGLVANSQKGWPTLEFDMARIFDYTHALWPAGFYNKTFKWPSWHTWEGMVRSMSGLGRPLTEPDPDHYEQVNAYCDLLICGGGPAGLMSALIAGRAGLRVILAEQETQFGGALNWEQVLLDGHYAGKWVHEVVTELETLSNVILLPSTVVSGVYDHNTTTLLQRGLNTSWRECFWTVRPRHVLLTSGAIEQGLIFPHNDRPGIMLAGAIRHYLNRYAVIPGRSAIISTNNDSAYQTVIDLCNQGLKVKAVVDNRREPQAGIQQRMHDLGVEVFAGACISNTRGTRKIRSVTVQSLAGETVGKFSCDLLGTSGGWSPRVHLLCHARGSLEFDSVTQSFLPAKLPKGFSVAGAARGTASLSEVFAEAEKISMRLCAELGQKAFHVHQPLVTQTTIESRQTSSQRLLTSKRRQWIDLAHDVTIQDAELAVREGYDSVEHFKRYTTTGMSVDQGKTSNLHAFLALSSLTDRDIRDIGTTTFRPPYVPVTLGAIAGRNQGDFYAPRRHLPAHRVHLLMKGHFEDYGGWQRPDCYPLKGETDQQAIEREADAVRRSLGVFDNSPIGKIAVKGPHAAEFLSRIYVNNVHNLAVGRSRYGLMLNENGVIIDDGVFSRLADDHFLVNTTSGGVHRIYSMFEEWLQCEWTELEVLVEDVTTQWANFVFAGPRSREFLQSLVTDMDLSADNLSHMAVASGTVAGESVRIVRVSFSGELSFEVNLSADRATAFLAQCIQAGGAFGLTPYGIEALMVLRLEKGFLHVGSDTDGETLPVDVGWGHVIDKKSEDFIGKRSLLRPAGQDPERKQLVGLVALENSIKISTGAHLLIGSDRKAPAVTDGWVTSAAFSPNLGKYVALGMLRAGRSQTGSTLTAIDGDERYSLQVVKPPFFDPENKRLEA
jgi:sarcosine oxidase subunit alpha